jgi:hypothetical protein
MQMKPIKGPQGQQRCGRRPKVRHCGDLEAASAAAGPLRGREPHAASLMQSYPYQDALTCYQGAVLRQNGAGEVSHVTGKRPARA